MELGTDRIAHSIRHPRGTLEVVEVLVKTADEV
jgi:hypothetical protein